MRMIKQSVRKRGGQKVRGKREEGIEGKEKKEEKGEQELQKKDRHAIASDKEKKKKKGKLNEKITDVCGNRKAR